MKRKKPSYCNEGKILSFEEAPQKEGKTQEGEIRIPRKNDSRFKEEDGEPLLIMRWHNPLPGRVWNKRGYEGKRLLIAPEILAAITQFLN